MQKMRASPLHMALQRVAVAVLLLATVLSLTVTSATRSDSSQSHKDVTHLSHDPSTHIHASHSYDSYAPLPAHIVRPYERVRGRPYNVSYDSRALLINGERVLLQSGSVHYPRSSVAMWKSILAQAKAHGLNMIETYVFWNIHEEVEGVYDFSTDNRNLTAFLQECADAGMLINLRLGPYVCAEWNLGGIPSWLKLKEGVVFRTMNEVWLEASQRFVSEVVKRVEPFLARNGGPIVLAQIENEYGNEEIFYGPDGAKYVQEIAAFAQSLNIDVPWIMCVQSDAPQNIINTCNGFYCDNWIAQHAQANPTQPHLWTENWDGWFQHWSESVPHRPVEDTNFAVARWIMRAKAARKPLPPAPTHAAANTPTAADCAVRNVLLASVSYRSMCSCIRCRFFGGTNFGRTVGGPAIITSYDYDVALNEYGQPNPAKWNQSTALHYWISYFSAAIMQADVIPPTVPLGWQQEAITYPNSSSPVIIFLANIAATATSVTPPIAGAAPVELPAWSVSIFSVAHNAVVFNTATGPWLLPTHHSSNEGRSVEMMSTDTSDVTPSTAPVAPGAVPASAPDTAYHCALDLFGISSDDEVIESSKPLEQVSVTQDLTDYLFYTTNVDITSDMLSKGSIDVILSGVSDYTQLALLQPPHTASVVSSFVTIDHAVTGNETFTLSLKQMPFLVGQASLWLLTTTLGLQNYGPYLEHTTRGVQPGASIVFGGQELIGAANVNWTQKAGVQGEKYDYVHVPTSNQSLWLPAETCSAVLGSAPLPLVWYRLSLSLALDSDPDGVFALDLNSMGKGVAYVNGHHIGRYVITKAQPQHAGECDPCTYTSHLPYDSNYCRTGCNEASQRYYHVPREWLNDGTNEITIFEELLFNQNGTMPDPTQIIFVRRNYLPQSE